jgi:hypothetical protein
MVSTARAFPVSPFLPWELRLVVVKLIPSLASAMVASPSLEHRHDLAAIIALTTGVVRVR